MKKSISIILAVLMLVSCIPMFASAATITLSTSNIEIIPPSVTVTDINFGDSLAEVSVTGGQLWYVDGEGNKTEVAGYFDIRNKTTTKPTVVGEYEPQLMFYPEDTTTYNASVRLSYLTARKTIKEGYSWPVIYIHGTLTTITTPPSFTCDAGDNLAMYPNYTKTGGSVVDANGNNVTSKGQFYIDEANSGGKNQYLYEDTYVTARWDDTSKSGLESSYYENVLVKVSKKTATLTTAPTIPDVFVGTTYGDALAQLTAMVTLKGATTTYDSAGTYWVPVYPEGITAETPINEATTITVKYESPVTNDTFTCEVAINVYEKPVAVISEAPTADTTGIKPGMKASALTLTGGKAVKEGTDIEVTGTFTVKDPEKNLFAGTNKIDVIFTPADLDNYDGSEGTATVEVASLIVTLPTIDATNVYAGEKVSKLILSGGEATEEGTFVFIYPDRILSPGSNSVSVKFIPAAEGAEYYETKSILVKISKEYRFLDKDGNVTTPVYTISYGKRLKDNAISVNTICNQTGCYLNAKEKYAIDVPDGQDYIISNSFSGVLLPVGEHTFYVKVKPSGYTINQTPPYEATTLAFIVKVEPVTMNVTNVSHSGLDNELIVKVDNIGAEGTYDIFVDGVQIADNAEAKHYGTDTWLTVKAPWIADVKINKEYSVKVVYNPIENDPVSMEDYEGTFRTNHPFTVYKDGRFTMYQGKNQVSGDSYSPAWEGSTRIQCVVPYEYQADFITWYITDEDGNELDIEVYGIEKTQGTGTQVGTLVETKVEAELSDTTIYFDMPNCNVRVSYKTQSQLDEEAKQEAIDNCNCLCHYTNPIAEFIWKIISFFMNLFGIDKPCNCGYPHIVK
ncbi:MAG: hypothetical protein IJO68_03010 [Clostridia bacterium]|nr:hypothetical protein [Clostridia bacterium]